MTTIAKKEYNPATKQYRVLSRKRKVKSRKHGRPRNHPRVWRERQLA